MASFGDQPMWPPMYRPDPYDAMVFTESGANGQHYYAMDSVGHVFCIDSPTACIQEAVNYVLSKPTGGRVYIRAGDYYFAPFNAPSSCGNGVICANIPYNAALIVDGDGDATRLHLPQNNTSNNAYLFWWIWNGTAPYTRKSILRRMAFINDVNTGSQWMSVMATTASTNNSSGLEVDSVSVYDINATSINAAFWINLLYDVTFSRYRFFSINNNTPRTAALFDTQTMGKIVNSFIFSYHGGWNAIENGAGTILVDSTEIYGMFGNVFQYDQTDGASHISVTNSIIGVPRINTDQLIQGYNGTNTGISTLLYNYGGGYVSFYMENTQLTVPISYNGGGYNSGALIRINNVRMNTFCKAPLVNINNVGSTGSVNIEVLNSWLGFNDQFGSCDTAGAPYVALGANNITAMFKRNVMVNNGTDTPFMIWFGSNVNATFEENTISIWNINPYFVQAGLAQQNVTLYFRNNTINWSAGTTPSSPTTFYLVYNPNGSGSSNSYIPTTTLKGNTFNLPTSNASLSMLGSAGVTISNPNAVFVDLDNIFNLSVSLPYPSVSTPAVPSSGTAQQNTYQYPVEVYVSGGSATAVQVTRGGATYTVWSSSTATAIPPLLVRLEPGDRITLTYSTAPSWTWVPAKYIG